MVLAWGGVVDSVLEIEYHVLHQSQLVAIQEFLFSSKGRSFCVPHDTL